eukprot:m.81424 g.81424  ORF g.81424 m.81424 type:complete len:640 (-) comp9406_c0_seq5:1988-3907(-)
MLGSRNRSALSSKDDETSAPVPPPRPSLTRREQGTAQAASNRDDKARAASAFAPSAKFNSIRPTTSDGGAADTTSPTPHVFTYSESEPSSTTVHHPHAVPAARPETHAAKVKMATPRAEFAPWQLNREAIKRLDHIGEGNFGAVHKGEYVDPSGVVIPVTLKPLRHATITDDFTLEPRRLFLFEASVLMELQHPNILWLIGLCTDAKPWLMVTEFLEYGDLRSVLEQVTEKHEALTPNEQIHVIQNIAAGMLYLASKQFIHRDLRARNCFVAVDNTGKTVTKISDFGMSSLLVDPGIYSCANGLDDNRNTPLRWMAPESMKSFKFTLRSDVWSFGMLVYEVVTGGCVPFDNVSDARLQMHIVSGKRPHIPKECTPIKQLGRLMNATWALDSKQRPDMFDITTRLSDAAASVPTTTPVRNIGQLAYGALVSPYDALPALASSRHNAHGESPYEGLTVDHTIYSTTMPDGPQGDSTPVPHACAHACARRPHNGPGAVTACTEDDRTHGFVEDTYEALENDRAIYAATNGLGSSQGVQGLDVTAPYYHGVCSRVVAERALLSQGSVDTLEGTFLVRQSPRSQDSLVVSVVFDGCVWHYRMKWTGEAYSYYGNTFKTVDDLIKYHLTERGVMFCCLTTVCSRF